MSSPYTVKYGDTLTSIAQRHGLGSWREVYYHPDNAAFRRKRPDPDRIFLGDVLMLPSLAPHPGPAPVPTAPVLPVPKEPEVLSTHFLLIQSGAANQFMSHDHDFFFRILDAQNPHVPRIYWLGPPAGYKHVTSKAEFNNENYRHRSTFHVPLPGKSITDLECRAFYVTRYKQGHRGLLSQIHLGLQPHSVTVIVQRPFHEGKEHEQTGGYNHQRPGRFQLVENPERYVIDHSLPNPFL